MSANARLQRIANLRVRWQAQGEPDDYRSAAPTGPGFVIEAYAEGKGITTKALAAGVLREGETRLEGIITRWAFLPQGADWREAGAGWAWTAGGLRPPGLLPGAGGPAFWGALGLLPGLGDGEIGELRFAEVGGAYGVGGVGERIRARLGDQFVASFGRPA